MARSGPTTGGSTTLPVGHPFDGSTTIVMITLDTLRFDAADTAWRSGRLPTLSPHLGPGGWERRHTPASFTYAAHHAFFSGFLPTPIGPGPHPRLYAASFAGSESSTDSTFVFPSATLPQALSQIGFHTICIGGTGFFNPGNELGSVLPSLFDEAHWNKSLGVTDPASPHNQTALAVQRLQAQPGPAFLFMNVSAIHQPNWFYSRSNLDSSAIDTGPRVDDLESHISALAVVDAALSPLLDCLTRRGPSFCIVCSDHGTAYGEDGHIGHRHGHPVVWDVPYAQFAL